MFTHLLRYRLKQLLKNKSIIFWSLFFPIILACFFKMAFSNLDSEMSLNMISVGIVETTNSPKNTLFKEAMTTANNNDQVLFKMTVLTKKEGEKALKENKMSGYYLLSEEEPNLIVSANGFEQTILKNFLQQFNYQTASIEDVLNENPELLSPNMLKDLTAQQSYTKEVKYSASQPKGTTLYFITVIAMACTFGMNWGIKNSAEVQANQSAKGIRMNMVPINKSALIVTNLFASFLIFFTEIMLVLAFIHFVLGIDLGTRWQYILFTCFLASLLSISLGSLIGSGFKGNEQLKSTIVTVFSIFGSFLAGMMLPQVKPWVDQHLPLLSWLNPTGLITDALYKLYYYDNLESYFITISVMSVMIVGINLANYFIMRRQTYVSI